MAEHTQPAWKQIFDAVDKRIGPRINEFARSEEFSTMAAANKRGQVALSRRLERVSRRVLHVMNLPAGSDVNRLLTHIAQLEREVRNLRKDITDGNDAEFLAALPSRRPTATNTARTRPTQQTPTKRAAAMKATAKKTTTKKTTTKKTTAKKTTAKRPGTVAARTTAKRRG